VKLSFTLYERPIGANNLYADAKPVRKRNGRFVTHRFESSASKVFKLKVLDAALDAADDQGWDLAYDGPASVTIVDFRPRATGLDWDGIPKAIQDALQPQIIRNDREAWHGEVFVVVDKADPRVCVILETTTRGEIEQKARAIIAS
jgi:hypothetical protein